MAKKESKYYALIHPGGPGGVVMKKPRERKQDRRFRSAEFYAVVFFPKITGIGRATANFHCIAGTLAQSPAAAKVRFMDRIKQGEKWKTYHDAGHRVRKIKILDLGET